MGNSGNIQQTRGNNNCTKMYNLSPKFTLNNPQTFANLQKQHTVKKPCTYEMQSSEKVKKYLHQAVSYTYIDGNKGQVYFLTSSSQSIPQPQLTLLRQCRNSIMVRTLPWFHNIRDKMASFRDFLDQFQCQFLSGLSTKP